MVDVTFVTYLVGLVVSVYLFWLQSFWIWRVRKSIREAGISRWSVYMLYYTYMIITGIVLSMAVLTVMRYYYNTDIYFRDIMLEHWIWKIRLWPMLAGMLVMAVHGTIATFRKRRK